MIGRNGYLCAAAAVAAMTVLWSASPAAADAIADFYAGKQIKIYIRAAPGGNYDTYSRTLGRHITRYLPGNPVAVPINMPGGGGLKALNYVANVAPKDGTVLTMVTQSFPMDQALGLNKSLKVDLRKLAWIGNMSISNDFFFTSPKSPTRTLDDAKRRVTIIGAAGISSVQTQLAALYNNRLHTRFKIIYGYRGAADELLAMERGEVEGRSTGNPLALFPNAEARQAPEYQYHFLIQTGLRKLAGYPDVPLLNDLATGPEEKEIFGFISNGVAISRPIATTGGVPAVRVSALRRAFDATLKDPKFLDEAKRQGMEISPMTGEELQKIVAEMINTPKPVLEKVRVAVRLNPADAVKGGAKKDAKAR